MSRLEKMIGTLCPDGVEYKSLGDLCDISTGKLNANAKNEDGIYPFFTCDAKPYKINNYAFDTTAIIISGNGSQVGHINFYSGKFNAYQRTYVLDNFKNIEVKYLLHYLTAYLKPYIIKNSKKGSVPYITLPMLDKFDIPVPPLEVQREIVRILDSFTELTEELTTELTARKQQYEYYSDRLLTSVNLKKHSEKRIGTLCPDGVEYKALKDILVIKNGSDYKRFPKGDIPVYGSGGIIAYTSKSVFNKPSVLIPRKGSIDKLYYVDTPFWNVDTIFYTDINTDVAIPRYVYHCLMREHLEKLNTAGGVPSLTQAVLNKVVIPIPPLDVQREIVRILDSFTELTEELTTELTARKQQYEYYRDKLLSFKKTVILNMYNLWKMSGEDGVYRFCKYPSKC